MGILFSKPAFLQRFLLLILLFVSIQSIAQTDGLGTWNVVSSKYTFNKKWFGFFEAQLRSQKMYSDFSYYEYKGGIGYNSPLGISSMLAMGHYMTYTPDGNFKDPVLNDEFRIWEQFVVNSKISRLTLEHRYRIEQRFTSTGYKNRFRYRLNAILPLNNTTIKPKTWYLSLYEEIFVNNESPFMEQNRIYFGGGYDINKTLTLQMGFVNRLDNSGGSNHYDKTYFQTMFLFSLDEFKSGRDKHPSAVD